jgi:uncharacterized protein YpmS
MVVGMTEDEAILWMTMGFMIIIGIWLISLTYLVLKRTKPEKEEDKQKEEEPAAEEKVVEDTEEKEELEEPEKEEV